jgi:hypothetical protein
MHLSLPKKSDADDPGTVEGVVEAHRFTGSGQAVALHATVRTESGDVQDVYMHGGDIVGVVDKGHRIRFEIEQARYRDGVAEVKEFDNLSTGARVVIWRPPAWRRYSALVTSVAVSAVFGPCVGAIAAWLLNGSASGTTNPDGALPVAAIALSALLALIVAVVTFRHLYVLPRAHSRAALTAAPAVDRRSHPVQRHSSFEPLRWVADAGIAVLLLSGLLVVVAAYLVALLVESA